MGVKLESDHQIDLRKGAFFQLARSITIKISAWIFRDRKSAPKASAAWFIEPNFNHDKWWIMMINSYKFNNYDHVCFIFSSMASMVLITPKWFSAYCIYVYMFIYILYMYICNTHIYIYIYMVLSEWITWALPENTARLVNQVSSHGSICMSYSLSYICLKNDFYVYVYIYIYIN